MATLDTAILTDIQYVLLEPVDGGATFPSGLWTPDEVLDRLNERQDRFLKASRILVGIATLPAQAGVHQFALPSDWLSTLSVVWEGNDGLIKELPRSDSFEADHGLPSWTMTRGTPQLYMDEDSPLLTIQIAPAPQVSGRLQILYIPQGVTLTGTGELLTVPDEFSESVAKYGTLADLFGKDGRGKNPEKAAYCEQRYALAQQVAGIILDGWV